MCVIAGPLEAARGCETLRGPVESSSTMNLIAFGAICRAYTPHRSPGNGSGAGPVEGDVLARIRRPLELIAECIHGADRRLAPSYELWAGSCLAARRVHELRILSWQARRSRQRLCPRLHLSRDLRSPVGAVGRNFERDPRALDSAKLPAFGKHRAPQGGKASDAASDNKLQRLGLPLVGTLVDEEPGRTLGLPRPKITFPSAHPDETETVEIDVSILAMLDVPEED